MLVTKRNILICIDCMHFYLYSLTQDGYTSGVTSLDLALLALQLCTDALLQREIRKTYRAPCCRDMERLRLFADFALCMDLLKEMYYKVITEHKQPRILFNGINHTMPIANFLGKGVLSSSTTTDLHVIRPFRTQNGRILVLRPKRDDIFRVMDISWISDYPNEKEYLISDHTVGVECVISSSDYERVPGRNELKDESVIIDIGKNGVDDSGRNDQIFKEGRSSLGGNLNYVLKGSKNTRVSVKMLDELADDQSALKVHLCCL